MPSSDLDIAGVDGPKRFGDYLIVRRIGEGGMGRVYEAEEHLTRRRVALKLLHGELAQSERGRRQFITEMSVLASLDHPNIVRCLRGAEIEGELVMVLEVLEGETLRERLIRAAGPLDWREAVRIAAQIAAALAAAHGHAPPIIHRDIKPENVMVSDALRVKVMDFGIAKVLQTIPANTTHSVGTLQYMSPEQIDARPVDARSDIFALGLVLWEMLAGHPPFRADSPRVLLEQLCTGATPAIPDAQSRGVPGALEQLVHEMLEKQPERRPASAQAVADRLASVLAAGDEGPAKREASRGSNSDEATPIFAPVNTVEIVARAAQPRRGGAILPLLLGGAVVLGVAVWWMFEGVFGSAPAPERATAPETNTEPNTEAEPTPPRQPQFVAEAPPAPPDVIRFPSPYDGAPLTSVIIRDGILVEDFELGSGAPVGEQTLVELQFKGFASTDGRQVMGSTIRTPAKLVISDAGRERDSIGAAMIDALLGMRRGGKRRIMIPDAVAKQVNSPAPTNSGDLWLIVDLVSVADAPVLAGPEAFTGTPFATQRFDSGLEVYDFALGEGPAAQSGDRVVVHYIGQLTDGTEFDSSHGRAGGLDVVLGRGGLIAGFDQGLVGVRAGMLRKLVVPASLGYGERGLGKIPANSTLVFLLQVIEVGDPQSG